MYSVFESTFYFLFESKRKEEENRKKKQEAEQHLSVSNPILK